MLFNMKRYYYGFLKYRSWVWLFVLPPLAYLIITAFIPSQFVISQDIKISSEFPVALMSSPTEYNTMQEIISSPEGFFQNTFALRALYNQMNSGIGDYQTDPRFRLLASSAKQHMHFDQIGKGTIRVFYQGPDQSIGFSMVGFYSGRLIQNAMAGINRSEAKNFQKPNLIGEIKTKEQRILWQTERLWPLFTITIISLLVILILCGMLEYRDSSFKSERQMARYLGLPILGSIPDLNRVYSAMEK
jgi:hypothetical protein